MVSIKIHNYLLVNYTTNMLFRQVDSELDFLMEHLSPLFTVDKLLPRTLLCVMSLEHLPRLVSTLMFPPDACLANCFFFIHTMTISSDFEVIKIIIIIYLYNCMMSNAQYISVANVYICELCTPNYLSIFYVNHLFSSSSTSSSNFSAPSFSGIQIRRRDQNKDTLVIVVRNAA